MESSDKPGADPHDSAPTGSGEAGGAGGEAGRGGGETERGGTEAALRALEARLARASEAAERLLGEAAGAAARAGADAVGAATAAGRRPPPAGWQQPEPAADPRRPGERELEALLDLVRSLRDLIPPELQRRLTEAVRDLLVALRALIDWYLERVEQRNRAPATIQDIPIL